jgi:hypothetical protein
MLGFSLPEKGLLGRDGFHNCQCRPGSPWSLPRGSEEKTRRGWQGEVGLWSSGASVCTFALSLAWGLFLLALASPWEPGVPLVSLRWPTQSLAALRLNGRPSCLPGLPLILLLPDSGMFLLGCLCLCCFAG